MTNTAGDLDAREREYWNGPGGASWVRNQERVDAVLAPVAGAALERANVREGEHVVDVGCGCGATCLELGRLVGPRGKVLGLDVSAPMVELAQQRVGRGTPIHLVVGDAATHAFRPGGFDLVFSRFGVMFFGDPVRAFANLRIALRSGGRLHFACWRSPKLNPWMMVPLEAAYEHVPRLSKPEPEDPGPFSLAAEDRVRRILGGAGYSQIALEPVDLALDMANAGGLDAAVSFAFEVGAPSRALENQPPDVLAAVSASMRRALAPYLDGPRVNMPAAVWLVSARSA